MRAPLPRGCDSLTRPRTIGARAVQIPFGGVLGRCNVVNPAALRIDSGHFHGVARRRRHRHRVPAIQTHRVGPPPAVALAQPKEALATLEPIEALRFARRAFPLRHKHPGIVLIAENHLGGARTRIAQIKRRHILPPVQLRHGDAAFVRPVHAEQIILPRIARNLHPLRLSAGDADDSHAHRRILGARLRVGKLHQFRIERFRVVDDGVLLDAAFIQLPERDVLSVRRPAERIAQIEFLFVHPVGSPVDQGLRTIRSQGADGARGDVLHIEIVRPHVRQQRTVRREFGEHQRRSRRIAAQLLQRARRPLEQPMVAACVGAPRPLRLGEYQQPVQSLVPLVILDPQRLLRVLGSELRGRYQHRPFPAGRVVFDDVLGRCVRGGRLQSGECRASADPPRRTETLARQSVRLEDADQPLMQLVGSRHERRKSAQEREGQGAGQTSMHLSILVRPSVPGFRRAPRRFSRRGSSRHRVFRAAAPGSSPR